MDKISTLYTVHLACHVISWDANRHLCNRPKAAPAFATLESTSSESLHEVCNILPRYLNLNTTGTACSSPTGTSLKSTHSPPSCWKMGGVVEVSMCWYVRYVAAKNPTSDLEPAALPFSPTCTCIPKSLKCATNSGTYFTSCSREGYNMAQSSAYSDPSIIRSTVGAQGLPYLPPVYDCLPRITKSGLDLNTQFSLSGCFARHDIMIPQMYSTKRIGPRISPCLTPITESIQDSTPCTEKSTFTVA